MLLRVRLFPPKMSLLRWLAMGIDKILLIPMSLSILLRDPVLYRFPYRCHMSA